MTTKYSDWSDWEDGHLTWCEDCGNSDSQLRMCPECAEDLCYNCGTKHNCLNMGND